MRINPISEGCDLVPLPFAVKSHDDPDYRFFRDILKSPAVVADDNIMIVLDVQDPVYNPDVISSLI